MDYARDAPLADGFDKLTTSFFNSPWLFCMTITILSVKKTFLVTGEHLTWQLCAVPLRHDLQAPARRLYLKLVPVLAFAETIRHDESLLSLINNAFDGQGVV
jgi:hypothetical protein